MRGKIMNASVMINILSYIDEHIKDKISLNELSKQVGYSPFYFSKLFSETMGISVTGYIRTRKLQYAMASLVEGEKVLDVALMYSFESHEGFTRSFSKMFGTTPSKVKKYLASYKVPDYCVPDEKEGSVIMELNKKDLLDNMHQMLFEVLRNSLEEVKEGFCSDIEISIYKDGWAKITDNGRGIPLSQKGNDEILNRIFSGAPITAIDYGQMDDFSPCSLQTVNSLCENLQVKVFRDGKYFCQDYVRGVAQHDLNVGDCEHVSGTTILMKPDSLIFGELIFSKEKINNWLNENYGRDCSATIRIWEE